MKNPGAKFKPGDRVALASYTGQQIQARVLEVIGDKLRLRCSRTGKTFVAIPSACILLPPLPGSDFPVPHSNVS